MSALLRRHAGLPALGLAVLIHAGVALIPMPGSRAAENQAEPEIEPRLALRVRTRLTGDSASPPAAPPDTQPARPSIRDDDSRAHTDPVVRPVARPAVRPAARQSPPDIRRAGPEPAPQTDRPEASDLDSRHLNLAGVAAAPAVDYLPDPLADPLAEPLAGEPGIGPGKTALTGPPDVDRHAYALRVRALVEASKRYPARARRQGQEGEVTVRLRIAPDGRLLGQPRVIASSGAEALDREAVRMVHRAVPFPPSGAAAAIELVVPVRFSLSDR